MRHILPLLLFSIILVASGCEKNKKENLTSENTKQNKITSKKAELQKEQIQGTEEIKLHSVTGDNIIFIKQGKNVKLKDNNKLILVNFFATWCPPCKAEIPHLINLQKKYKNSLKIVSILLEKDKQDDEIKSFIKYNHINYIVTNGHSNFTFSTMLGGIENIPFMILYDKDGKVITHYLGAIPEEMIESDIKKAIGK